jgi:hypothetical protein
MATPGRTLATIAAAALSLGGCASPLSDVPDVEGSAVDDAVTRLEGNGFTPAYAEGRGPEDDMAGHWVVRSQRPGPGPGAAGASVELQVTSVLQLAADRCDVDGAVGDGGSSLELDMEGEDLGSGVLSYTDVACVLQELDVPDSVVSKMDSTRSIDGRQTEDWDGIEANWTYHPDDGLDVILELRD